jgi:hypothetical protein
MWTAYTAADQIRVYAFNTTALDIASFDNVSVKALPGNHAFQTSSTKRPVLRARYNQITYSEDISNASWVKYNSTTPNATTIQDTAVNDFHYIDRGFSVSFVSGVSYTFRARLEKGTIGFGGIHLQDGTPRGCSINLTTGQLGTPYGGATATAVADGSGWILTVTAAAGATTATGNVAVYMSTSNALAGYTGTGTGTISASKLDFRPTSQATGAIGPTYQRIAAATDYDVAGFLPYLSFDGFDDALTTNSIDFSATDKMTVFAGVRKLSDAALGVVVGNGVGNGSFEMFAPRASGGSQSYAFAQRTTTVVEAIVGAATYPAPDTAVLTGTADIGAPLVTLRRNGAQVVSNNAALAAGNFGNFALNVGSRDGASLYFTGWLSSLIGRGAATAAGQISATEQWVNTKTGAY